MTSTKFIVGYKKNKKTNHISKEGEGTEGGDNLSLNRREEYFIGGE